MQVRHRLQYDVVFASLQHIVAVRCLVSHVSNKNLVYLGTPFNASY